MQDPCTTDLSDFGWRERRMAATLLTVSCDQGLPDDFEDDAVTIMMNRNSGHVFLTNSEFQVAMMNGDALESWYNCPYCGHEGFKEDMEHGTADDRHPDCTEFLVQIGVITQDAATEDEEADEEGDNAS